MLFCSNIDTGIPLNVNIATTPDPPLFESG
jgi:hypothetical protein